MNLALVIVLGLLLAGTAFANLLNAPGQLMNQQRGVFSGAQLIPCATGLVFDNSVATGCNFIAKVLAFP